MGVAPHGHTPARGWHRPVRPVALLWVGGVLLLIWLALMVGGVHFFYTHWQARVALRDQPLGLQLPAGLLADAQLAQAVRLGLDARPRLRVPVRQSVSAELSDTLLVEVPLRARVPVRTTLNVAQQVPVRATLQLQVPVVAWLPAFKVELPVAFSVPIELRVPVDTEVPLALHLQVSADLSAALSLPVNAVFETRPHLQGAIEAQVHRALALRVDQALQPLPLMIEQAQLDVPFDVPRLHRRGPARGLPARHP